MDHIEQNNKVTNFRQGFYVVLKEVRKDFVYDGTSLKKGENFYFPEYHVSGLVQKGLIWDHHRITPAPTESKTNCAQVDCYLGRLDNSLNFEVQSTESPRITKQVDITLEDQRIIDQTNKLVTITLPNKPSTK